MALVKWNPNTPTLPWRPFTEFDTMRREMDRVFNTLGPFGGSDGVSREAMWTPRVDLIEQDEEYVLHAELPGMKLEDIHIQFHAGMLTIQGERQMEHEAHDGYHWRERAYGAFSRRFMLGSAVDADTISATYRDGMLEIRVPKTAEAKAKRITIQAA